MYLVCPSVPIRPFRWESDRDSKGPSRKLQSRPNLQNRDLQLDRFMQCIRELTAYNKGESNENVHHRGNMAEQFISYVKAALAGVLADPESRTANSVSNPLNLHGRFAFSILGRKIPVHEDHVFARTLIFLTTASHLRPKALPHCCHTRQNICLANGA